METKVISVRSDAAIAEAVGLACKVLSNNGLVAFPTDTVYGLAARADLAESLEKLAELKERPKTKPFTLHIGRKSILNHYVPHLSPLNCQLIKKAWPGPLTVIFGLNGRQERRVGEVMEAEVVVALYHNSTIGIRLPDNVAARELLNAVDGPVVAPSANLAGSRAPACAEEVLEELDGKIEMVLDGGPTKYAKPSTIVRLSDSAEGGMEVLRAGVLDAATVVRMRSLSILFVCTGNSCRSAMAEGLCKKRLAEKLGCSVDELAAKGYKVGSAGVSGYDGGSASADAIEVCRQMGVDIGGHRARALTVDLVNEADYVFVMTQAHRQAVLRFARQAGPRTMLLGRQDEIDDPMGMGLEQYRSCAERIDRCVREQLEETIWA